MRSLTNELKEYFERCKSIQRNISILDTMQISNKRLKAEIEKLACDWFNCYSSQLNKLGLGTNVQTKYDQAFKSILGLVGGNNRKTSYLQKFDLVCSSFRNDIIIFVQTEVAPNPYTELISRVEDKEENEYLSEALNCLESGYLKASVVLGWCAAVDRIHKKIEQIGFNIFNKTSEEMKQQTVGRFKKYNKNQNVNSLSEIRIVFDSDLLLIIEGMGLIDVNQGTRLASCFEMRCHSGHPGNAPITPYNTLSFFSDIIEIILSNPTFKL